MNNGVVRIRAGIILGMMLVLGLAGCGDRITKAEYRRIETGMTRDQVIAVLGTPDALHAAAVGELSGASAAWRADERVVSVLFVNGKVVFKSLGEASAGQENQGWP